MFRTIKSIFCNESTYLSHKPECQQKGLNWSISFIPGPFIGYQCPGDLLIRVLSWSLFSERGAGELSAGNTRIRSRANKNSSRKRWGRGRGQPGGSLILDGLACQVFSSWPRHGWGPGRPCLPGIFFMTSSRAGLPIMAPGICPLPLEIPSYLPPFPTPLGCYRAPVWVPWVIEQISIGCLFYIWRLICFHATQSHFRTSLFLQGNQRCK